MSKTGKNRFHFEEERDDSSPWVFRDEFSRDEEPVYLDEPAPGREPPPRKSHRSGFRTPGPGFFRYLLRGSLVLVPIVLGVMGYLYYTGYFQGEGASLSFFEKELQTPREGELKDRFFVPEQKKGTYSPELERAMAAYYDRNREEARRLFKSFVNGPGEDSEKSLALVYMGLMGLETERFEEARHNLKRALRYDPDSLAAIVNLAIVERRLGNFEEARNLAARARKMAPDDQRVTLLVGNLLAESQDLAGAIESYREGLQSDTKDPLLYYNLALSLMRKGQMEEALLFFSRAAEAGEGEIALKARSWMGQIYFNQGNLELAADHLKRTTELAPDRGRYHYNLGVLYLRMNKRDKALESFRRALDAGENDTDVYRGLARAFLELGLPDEARRALERGLVLNPQDISSLFMLGDLYYRQKDLLAAERTYKRIVNTTPGDVNTVEALLKLGSVETDLERFDQAVEMFERVLRLEPASVDAMYRLGYAYWRTGHTDRAVALWKHAVARSDGGEGPPIEASQERMIRMALASLYKREGAPDLALEQLRTVEALNKRTPGKEDDPELDLEMAETYAVLKDTSHAIGYFTKAADSPRSSPVQRIRAYRRLAETYASTGSPEDLDRARSFANRAARMDPAHPEIRMLQASLLLKTESPVDREKAIEILRALTASDLDSTMAARAYNYLGLAYYENGEYSRAIRAFDHSVQLDPSLTGAYENQRAAVNAYERSLQR